MKSTVAFTVYLLKSKICQVPLFTSIGLSLSLDYKNLVLFTTLAYVAPPQISAYLSVAWNKNFVKCSFA